MLKLTISLIIVLVLMVTANAKQDPHDFFAPRFERTNMLANGMAVDNSAVPVEELDPNFWRKSANDEIRKRLADKPNTNRAKNVIFFLGDGMSLSTVTAARILKGQREGRPGEESQLSFEKFPYTGLSRTYCANAQVPDSACTSTAYLTGVKTNILSLGIGPNVNYNDCDGSMDPANDLTSLYDWAQAAGKSTGFITTTTLTHASPTGGYAHVANRMWESDTDVRKHLGDDYTPACKDIAQQLVTEEPGRKLDFIMGGGIGKFLPKTMIDPFGKPGERSDGKNLLSEWQRRHQGGVFVSNRKQMNAINLEKTTSILGIFQSKLMNYHHHATEGEPTLSEMTEKAIKFLSKNKNGYFVFIEGGLIDYGNHANTPGISLDETIELEKAVELARRLTDPEDTLIVVSADHAHPLSISGYPERGNDILNVNKIGYDKFGVHYATLNYAAGPQQYLDEYGNRIELEGKFGSPDFIFPSYITADSGVHGGDDVGVYASGPWEHLFRGVVQQNTLPHMMAYAACIGNGAKACD
ncbi:membrane-bound alkaline phosphatase [Zeugodacus cucurbitae]|uniref:membrane-bound alkaline phosphatase n=1 Tax=Zeugodacus cucurbitae TaxID=28588 RepID=UPI0023D95645|nr:membrane-bound alkaline phosphatase [Zeugodacus cucurbitae]XP_054089558.1 membrane-bound alkaline phosphatase [Zeugodacus cucurbitae]